MRMTTDERLTIEGQLNSELNACLLRSVISAYQQHDQRLFAEMGLTPTLMARARRMSADSFTRVCNKFPIATITFDTRRFELMLDYAEREQEMDDLTNALITLGASQSMMDALTGIDPRDYRERRTALGIAPAPLGRPPALTEAQAERLYAALQQCPERDDERQRCLFLGQQTQLPLAQVWAHMKLNGG